LGLKVPATPPDQALASGSNGESVSTKDELIAEVSRHEWLYSVDLGGGLVTPGRFGPPNPQIKEAFGQLDFRGKQVLDIGCFEGQWSFEAEKRGAARVLATDYLVGDPRARLSDEGIKELPTFRLAHAILGSRVEYRPDVSVYDITDLGGRNFDIVLFCGVYYHLKHPVLALSRLRQVTRDGGTLIVEGPVIDGPREAYARFFYNDVLADDRSNWWVPTLPCLLEWIECSYFEIVLVSGPTLQEVRSVGAPGVSERRWPRRRREKIVRHTVIARAVSRKDPHYVLPDEDLETYDRA
jgi:tRNA (mo5U34)-methyltransferase